MSVHPLPGMEALVFVRLSGPGFDDFERFLADERDVAGAWHVLGDVDLVVNVCCQSIAALEALVERMRATGGVLGTNVHLVLRRAAAGTAAQPEQSTGPTGTARSGGRRLAIAG